MKDILEQDQLLTEIFGNITKSIRENLAPEIIGEFTIEGFNDLTPSIDKYNVKGIYFFEIKNNFMFDDIELWKEDFINRWEDDIYKHRFVPNTRKVRLNKLNENKEWIPLYLGKSRNVSSRIKEHINKELEKNTFAMKLKARENFREELFRVSVLEIDVTHYDWIVPLVEKELRNIYNPIVGKQ
ncbi:hypothetical protein GJV76_14240 [Myroides sp. BIT-d1]|uniref:Uncharacterized protein n=1 Tax=Myroides albus TaxID=2562892 RepID=A0A6I3LI54_9FLAO|nr:hypothetical protein [Myroides albus]MTG99269.1 hypothetical protein [Myroides albus]